MKLRAANRKALVQKRGRYRQRGNYAVLEEQLKKDLTIYRDGTFFDKLANEYFIAGTSRIVPRKRSERHWVFGQDKCRADRREDIVMLAAELDKIDEAGGFDSAAGDDFRLPDPPSGDNHVNRAWKAILLADLRLHRHIIALGVVTWRSWLSRTAHRLTFPAVLILISAWSVAETGVSVLSGAAWMATMLSLQIAWTTSSNKKDSFIVAVGDIQTEHLLALVELRRRLRMAVPPHRPERAFRRDPLQQPLTDLLRRCLG